MELPFSKNDFFNVFAQYNISVWPSQILLYILAFTLLFFLFKKNQYSNRIISAILAFFWVWMGVVYHFQFFSVINKAAYLFALLFILQGLLFFLYGTVYNKINFEYITKLALIIGVLLISYSLLLYPLLSYSFGRYYPFLPTFGLPCPTTIFTLGVLSAAQIKRNYILFIVPVLWSFIGGSASLFLDVREDAGLLASGLLVIILFISKKNIK